LGQPVEIFGGFLKGFRLILAFIAPPKLVEHSMGECEDLPAAACLGDFSLKLSPLETFTGQGLVVGQKPKLFVQLPAAFVTGSNFLDQLVDSLRQMGPVGLQVGMGVQIGGQIFFADVPCQSRFDFPLDGLPLVDELLGLERFCSSAAEILFCGNPCLAKQFASLKLQTCETSMAPSELMADRPELPTDLEPSPMPNLLLL
jgi:hypothetical protein